MKKILHISKFYYPHAGGIEDVCYTITDIVKKHTEHKQLVVCFSDDNQTSRHKHDDVDVIRIAVDKIIASQPLSSKFYGTLKGIIKGFNPDIIHLHLPNPLVSLILLLVIPKKVKLIIHWHSDIIEQKIIYRFIKPIESAVLKRADKVIVTSPAYSEHSLPLAKWQNKCVIIPNVIDIDKFKNISSVTSKSEEINNSYNKPIVLFVGRHIKYKGIEFLIEAAKLLKEDCQIVIGGTGPLTEELKTKAKGVVNIDFIGRIPEGELAAYYYSASILAFPSITKNEAFGVVLAEAMYCKVPAITFTIEGSGVNWVSINNETGLEVANKNVVEYAKAIDSLLRDNDLREQMSQNAHLRVTNNFTVDRIMSPLMDLYSTLCR